MSTVMSELSSLSDEAAIQRVLDGDIAAFEVLMRRHNQRLYRVARAVVLDNLEAEDIVQDAFVRAYAHLHRFEGRSSAATWLTRIAFHEALRRKRRKERELAVGRVLADRQSSSAMSDPHNNAPAERDLARTRSLLTDALESLPVGPRAVVMLRLVHGLSTRETAACLRTTESNVKVMLHRAKQMLREQLGTMPLDSLCDEYSFGSERCDRVVDAVFRRIDHFHGWPSP